MTDPFFATRQVYENLGDTYVSAIANGQPPEMSQFLDLVPRGGTILDVGCAGGRDAKIFTDHGFSVIGVDVVDAFLQRAKRDVPQATFLHMDLRALTFQEDSFDAIWANAVLLHILKPELPNILKTFLSILKPGGVLHIRVKEGTGTTYEEDILSPDKRFFVYFEKEELEHHIERAGFTILESRIFPDTLGRDHLRWVGVWAKKPI